jgi:hypothetical protein
VGGHAHWLVDDDDLVVVVDDPHAGDRFGDDLEGHTGLGPREDDLEQVLGVDPV